MAPMRDWNKRPYIRQRHAVALRHPSMRRPTTCIGDRVTKAAVKEVVRAEGVDAGDALARPTGAITNGTKVEPIETAPGV